MNFPKVSIITASYNQGHFIEQTINSVLEQSYPNLEYIIIDGGSTDNSIEVIKKYEKHLAYWVSEKDKGQSDAINKGYQKATGTIINWLNSDDYYEPGSLAHIAQVFADPTINAYTGISRVFGENLAAVNTKGTDIYPGNLSKTMGWARIDQPETFFRKAAIDKIGYLNEGLHYIMDKDLWIRYLSEYGLDSVVKDQKLIAHFRLHGQSKTVSLKEKFAKESEALYYTYAQKAGATYYITTFQSLFNTNELGLDVFPSFSNEDLWDRTLNYFLLQRGLEAYAGNDYRTAGQVLGKVKADLLEADDKNSLQSVMLRIRYLPVGIKRLWNKIKN